MSKLLCSLILTTVMSFTTPVLLMIGLMASLWLISYLPWIAFIGQIGNSSLVEFLTIFGNGSPLPGLLVIGATCSFVGGVFDLFNFYVYQNSSVRGQ